MDLGLVIGILGALNVVGLVLWFLDRRHLKRANARALVPNIKFGTLELYGPDRPVRDGFNYAVGFSITNVGGPAIGPVVSLYDPQEIINSEPVSRAALVTNETMADASGIEGSTLSINPEADGHAFVRNAEWSVLCWDLEGNPYLFTPAGPVDLPETALTWSPQLFQEYLVTHKNKTGPPRGTGAGNRED